MILLAVCHSESSLSKHKATALLPVGLNRQKALTFLKKATKEVLRCNMAVRCFGARNHTK